MTKRAASTAISVSMPNDVYSDVKAGAEARGVPVSAYLTEAARMELARDGLREIVAEERWGQPITVEERARAQRELDEALEGMVHQ
jgi:hypothetical protein